MRCMSGAVHGTKSAAMSSLILQTLSARTVDPRRSDVEDKLSNMPFKC